MLPVEEFNIYGKYLVGNEDEIVLEKLMRERFLKTKMREVLKAEIGDCEDNVTDVLRGVLICYAVSSGIINDPIIVKRLNEYVVQMLDIYGGPEKIMDILEYGASYLVNHVKYKYFNAKKLISDATTVEEVRMIDID